MDTTWVVLVLLAVLQLQLQQSAADPQPMDYTTLKDQRHLVRLEQALISSLLNYTSAAEVALFRMQRYVTKYAATVLDPLLRDGKISFAQGWDFRAFEAMDQVAEHVAKNPVMAYQTVLRMDDEFKELARALDYHEASMDNLEAFLQGQSEQVELPGVTSVELLREGLLSMWHIYEWTFDDVRYGRLANVTTNTGLDAEDFLAIAEDMFERNMFSEAINVLGNTRNKLLGPHEDVDFVRRVEETLADVIEKHDSVVEYATSAPDLQNPFFFPEKVNQFETKHLQWPTRLKLPSDSGQVPDMEDPGYAVYVSGSSYPRLCKGERPPTDKSLKCFLISHHHPYWTLAPQKFEVISKDPFLIQVYDVVSDAMIEKFKIARFSELRRSVIVREDGGEENSNVRLSSSFTLHEGDGAKWNKIAELTTGLDTTSDFENEPIQITNYAPGGHFSPHLDALYSVEAIRVAYEEKRGDSRGDRLMTFMFYLSSMEGGGRTAFPIIQTYAEPVKGSALMWYNLHPNTTTDFRMAHGGCPVTLGTKWVATKWIRVGAQALRRQCAPQRDFDQEKYWFYDIFGLPQN